MRELTPRQKDVLAHLADGLEDKEIARELGISPCSVKETAQRVVYAMGARNRMHAVSLAYRCGLLKVWMPA